MVAMVYSMEDQPSDREFMDQMYMEFERLMFFTARQYASKTEIAEDMLQHIYKVADGSVRRIVVNLALVEEAARTEGRKRVTLDDWGGRAFYTGEAPKRGR